MKFLTALLVLTALAWTSADRGFILHSVNRNKTYDFGSQYSAVVYQLVVPTADFFVQGIDAMNKDGKGPDDVEALHVVHQSVRYLPKRLFDWYKNLNHLHIVDSELESLEGETLDARIRYLHLDGNRIQSVPVEFFRDAREMTLLSMERNRISQLHPDLLTTMPKLRWVSFSGNRIRTLPGTLLRANRDVECISFENNGLISTGRDLVNGLTKLIGVSFDGNVCINSAYFKGDENISEMVTRDLTAFCAGQCGNNEDWQNKIDILDDKIEEMNESEPKCNSIKAKLAMTSHDSSESDESEEHGEGKKRSAKSCPHARFDSMQ